MEDGESAEVEEMIRSEMIRSQVRCYDSVPRDAGAHAYFR
jgi:hypothetical protein